MKISKLGGVISVVAILLASTTASAVSFDSAHSTSRFNSAGTTTKVLPPHANHFCYLSSISIEETDTGGEEATCRVRRSGTVWILEARLDKSSDADAECTATCYNN